MTRGVLFEESDAGLVVTRLIDAGFEASSRRERLAGEDDDEDHFWVVTTDAPTIVVELFVEQHDGWLEPDAPPLRSEPPVLPDAPRRRHGNV